MHDVDLLPSPKQSEWIRFLQSVGQQQALAASAHKKQPHVAHLSWTNHISIKAVWSLCSSLNVKS